MNKTIYQLSYKFDGFPKGVPVVDCRVINNPYHRGKTDREMMETVVSNPLFNGLVEKGTKLLVSNDAIIVACAFGKHRSGTIAEEIARRTGATIVKGVNS